MAKQKKKASKEDDLFYHFVCDKGHRKEFCISLKIGPPINVFCDECKNPMYQEFGSAFVLKGEGWPGKSIKRSSYESAEAREKNDQEMIDDARKQRLADEVIATRRKGKKAVEKMKKEEPEKMKEYVKNMKERGIKGAGKPRVK